MINVVWVNYTYNDRRGPNKRFLELVMGLNSSKQNMKHIAVFPEAPEDSNMVKLCEENGVEYHFCNISWYANLCSNNIGTRQETYKQFLTNVKRLTEILQRTECDLVVSNTTLVWEVGIAAKRLGVKHITLIKGILNPYDFKPNEVNFNILRALEKDLINHSDYFVTHSYYTARLWNLDCDATCYKRIPLGTRCINEWSSLQLSKLPLKVVTFASIEENKNIGYIVEIAKVLKRKKVDCQFNIYGYINDSVYKTKLDGMIQKEELTDRIRFHDYQQNIDDIYKEHHIVFLPSLLETFGATAIEGMARCRPIISVKCGGPEEIIDDGVNGFLVDAFQPELVAEKFEFFINAPEKIVEYGMNGQMKYKNEYTIEASIKAWHSFLSQVYLDKKRIYKNWNDIQMISHFKKLLEIEKDTSFLLKNGCLNQETTSKDNSGVLRIITHLNPTNASLKVGLLNALDYIRDNNQIKYEVLKPEEITRLEKEDTLIFVRTLDKNAIPLLERAKDLGVKTVYYVDDCLFKVPVYARNSQHYNHPDTQETLKIFVGKVDQVVCSSEWLSKAYDEKYNICTNWIQPAIDKCSYSIGKKKESATIIIGFAGNVDHGVPLEVLRDTFLKLQRKYGIRLRFEFIGANPSFLRDINSLYFPPMSYSNYEMLMARRNWDIGIAYLEDTDFNNLKCFNKFLEYSKYNIAGIYSNISLYQRVIQNGENGLLANDHFYDWYEKIDLLIKNKLLRERIIKNAHKQVLCFYGNKIGAESIIKYLFNKL